MTKEEEIKKLKSECLEFCHNHSLYQKGTHPVFGEGSLEAKIMFIGEAPGYHESMTGHPFCGAAGEILDKLLDSVKIRREEIYITNIVKLRPPNNRDPNPEEIKIFGPFLEKQIEIIKPTIICSLGNYATAYIFNKYELKDQIRGIGKIHGKVFEIKSFGQTVKVIPLYHPAVVTYNSNMEIILKEDFRILEKFK